MREHYRQGDVMLVRVERIPTEAKEVRRGELVIALGEVTGHRHRIVDDEAVMFSTAPVAPITDDDIERVRDAAIFVKLTRRSQLVHEEHAAIDLPVGTYRVVRQREYSPAEIRRVAD